MKKLFSKICGTDGTALLVALLVMGVLIALSLALSSLVVGESRSTRGLIDAGRAYYAAESGIEQALYNLDTNLPGWEGEDFNIGGVADNAVFSYVVNNQCNSYPCFAPDEYDISTMTDYSFYGVLDLNETLTIPLFTVDKSGNVVPVEDFTVEFFVAFNPLTDLIIDTSKLSGWDVLRWKIFGLRESNDGSFVTESLHDFTAVSSLRNTGTGEEIVSNATKPSWFGTVNCTNRGNRSDPNIVCEDYTFPSGVSDNQFCMNTEARDYYLYGGDKFEAKLPCFSIKEFLLRNSPTTSSQATGLNYLTLTNLMNPSMLSADKYRYLEQRLEASRIYFRVETYDKNTVREFASITSDGYSGDSKESLTVNIKRDSYMPVFNFSVYSTYQKPDSNFYVDSDPKKSKSEGGLAL